MNSYNQGQLSRGMPTLGMMIRALRLGFGWSCKHGAFVRLSGGEGKPFLCELYPLGLIPRNAHRETNHWVWWKNDEGNPGIDLDGIEALRNLKRVKLPFSFYFDDNGCSV